MKILLLGREGQVGWELQRSLAPLGELVALGRNANDNPQELCGDLSDLAGLAHTVRKVAPTVIVNAAAHTAVDKAESEQALARTINGLAPGVLAQEAQKLGAWLVHYSTDYVFDGSGDAPWKESDVTGPLRVYGARGGNFAKTMLKLAQTRETMQVINDQFGAPTGADLLADVTAHAIRQVMSCAEAQLPTMTGTYHLAADGFCTWFEYANHVLALAAIAQPAIKMIVNEVRPVPTSAFPTPALRPHNSRLNTAKLQATFNLQMPHWKTGVDRMISEILNG
jgi:dTDP-4-dehydrorhamnose reductase